MAIATTLVTRQQQAYGFELCSCAGASVAPLSDVETTSAGALHVEEIAEGMAPVW